MSAAVACTPAAPVHVTSACRIDVTGAPTNTATGYDTAKYPSEPAVTYYLAFLLDAVERNRSYVFDVAHDGTHSLNSFTFDTAGTWTVNLNKAADDSNVANVSVTVS